MNPPGQLWSPARQGTRLFLGLVAACLAGRGANAEQTDIPTERVEIEAVLDPATAEAVHLAETELIGPPEVEVRPGQRVHVAGRTSFTDHFPLVAEAKLTVPDEPPAEPQRLQPDVAVIERPPWWSLKHTLMVVGVFGVVLLGALGWIRALRRRVEERTHQLKAEMEDHKRTSARLREKTELLQVEIEERKRTEAKLEKVHRELMDASRRAGMAEVATGVLHNVGNVLNSVNVSTNLLSERVKTSHVSSIGKLAQLLSENASDLGRFFTQDERGRQLPVYVAMLAQHLAQEQRTLLDEFESLVRNVDHIKEIVVTQQTYAKRAGIIETIAVSELVEDALRIHTQAYLRHGVKVVREFNPTPPITTDRHKVLQILVNFLSNAKYACDEQGTAEKRVTARVESSGPDRVRIEVADNGVGIRPENLSRIFTHGFTTRRTGHGFGLHSGALAAQELGGTITARSDGAGKGASFVLELPLQPPQRDEPTS